MNVLTAYSTSSKQIQSQYQVSHINDGLLILGLSIIYIQVDSPQEHDSIFQKLLEATP